jgi:hypothetical protein
VDRLSTFFEIYSFSSWTFVIFLILTKPNPVNKLEFDVFTTLISRFLSSLRPPLLWGFLFVLQSSLPFSPFTIYSLGIFQGLITFTAFYFTAKRCAFSPFLALVTVLSALFWLFCLLLAIRSTMFQVSWAVCWAHLRNFLVQPLLAHSFTFLAGVSITSSLSFSFATLRMNSILSAIWVLSPSALQFTPGFLVCSASHLWS